MTLISYKHLNTISFLVLLAVFISSSPNLYGQYENILCKNYSVEQGLSSRWVSCIAQDKTGFIWIGTKDGLNRFDGKNFKIYRHSKKKNSLSDNFINALLVDSSDNLWIGTIHSGLNLYNKEKDEFISYTHDSTNKSSLKNNLVSAIYQDREGNIWVGTWDGLEKFLPAKKSFIHYSLPYNESKIIDGYNLINTIFEDKKGYLWIGTKGSGVHKFDKKQGKFIEHYAFNTPGKKGLNCNYVKAISEDQINNLIIATWGGGLNLLNQATGDIEVFYPNATIPKSIGHSLLNNILSDKRGNTWIGSEGGFMFYHPTGENFTNYINVSAKQFGLEDLSISCFKEDRNGGIWIGTFYGGIGYFNPFAHKFNSFANAKTDFTNFTKGKIIKCFVQIDENHFLISFYNGLFLWERGSKKFENFHTGNSKMDNAINFLAPSYLFKDSKGIIWIATDKGLILYNPSKKKFKFVEAGKFNANDSKNFSVTGIIEDKKKNILIATQSMGLIYYDYKTNLFNKIDKDDFVTKKLKSNDIQCIFLDQDNQLWISLYEAIFKIDLNQEDFSSSKISKIQEYHLQYVPHQIIYGGKDLLWLAADGGLGLFNKKTGNVHYFNQEVGLSIDYICSIVKDNCQDLWISTQHGINKFNLAKGTIRSFYDSDGLSNNTFTSRSFFKDDQGMILFGGSDGFIAFYPDSIKEENKFPNLAFTDLRVYGQQSLQKNPELTFNIVNKKQLVLPYDQNEITIEYAAFEYGYADRIKYSYKMDGYSSAWLNNGTDRKVHFTNLKPNHYRFHLKSTNESGKWNNQDISIEIIINPPLWQRLWFMTLAILLFFSGIFLYYKIRINKVLQYQERLEMSVRQRTQELEVNNSLLKKRTEDLDKSNALLEERQLYIEEQSKKIKSTNEELTALISTKDKLFSILAHDLKNPFNIILGFSELLNANHTQMGVEKRGKLIHMIYSSSKNIYTLLENLLSWARTQTGEITIYKRKISLNDIIINCYTLFYPLAVEKNINLTLAVQGNLIVEADRDMLELVIRNLLSNAIKFTKKGGNITLATLPNGNKVEISVTDNGTGITPEELDHLFSLQNRKLSKGTEGETGTGLGLTLCYEFLNLNGSLLHVESKEGKGSKFWFELTAAKTETVNVQ